MDIRITLAVLIGLCTGSSAAESSDPGSVNTRLNEINKESQNLQQKTQTTALQGASPNTGRGGGSPEHPAPRPGERRCMLFSLSSRHLSIREPFYGDIEQCQEKQGALCSCRDDSGTRRGRIHSCSGSPLEGGGVSCSCECEFEYLENADEGPGSEERGRRVDRPSCEAICTNSEHPGHLLCLDRPGRNGCPRNGYHRERSVEAGRESTCCQQFRGNCDGWFIPSDRPDESRAMRGSWECRDRVWFPDNVRVPDS